LRDASNLLQQEVLGVVGVNLIYAVFHLRQFMGSSLKTLLDEVSVQRVEIDFIELRGPAFAGWNRQETLLALVREGLAEAVFIAAGESQAPPTEILRKKTIVLTPFAWKSSDSAQQETLSAAILQLKAESANVVSEPLSLFALSTTSLDTPSAPADSAALSRRVEALCASCNDVLVFGYNEFYRMTSFVNRYTQAPVRFAIEAAALIDFLSRTHNNLEGRLLEGVSKLFAQNVRVYVYPTATSAMQDSLVSASAAGWQWEEKNGLITADALRPAAPLGIFTRTSLLAALSYRCLAFLRHQQRDKCSCHRTSKEWLFNWLSKTQFALLLIEFRKKEARGPASFDSSTPSPSPASSPGERWLIREMRPLMQRQTLTIPVRENRHLRLAERTKCKKSYCDLGKVFPCCRFTPASLHATAVYLGRTYCGSDHR
jgi:hypothetical protein